MLQVREIREVREKSGKKNMTGNQGKVRESGLKSGNFDVGEVRAKKPSLTLNLNKRLEGDFRTTTNGRAGGLLARKESLTGHPSKQSHA
ncbi:hypothetical protein J6590_071416 [Homalodisca vitripennis]|nr:hypothetical protein J6590_071416 [Homalodisca vitripennis]